MHTKSILLGQYRARIANRLRLAFGVIFAILLVAFLIGSIQFLKIHRAEEATTQRSVPALVQAEKLLGQLTYFSEYVSRLRSSVTTPEINQWAEKLVERKELINQTIADIESLPQGSFIQLKQLQADLQLLDQLTDELIKSTGTTLGFQEMLNENMDKLRSMRARHATVLEPLSISAAGRYNSFLSQLSQTTNRPPTQRDWGTLRAYGKREFDTSEILSKISDIVESIETVSSQRDLPVLEERTHRLNFDLNLITQLLITLDNAEDKKTFATIIKDLRDLSTKENGIIPAAHARARSLLVFDQAEKNQYEIMTRISDSIHQSSQDTQDNALSAATQLTNTLRYTSVILSILGISIIGITLYVVYSVVENQFNNRIASLTSAVKDIAAGDVHRAVAVDGDDELGDMAKALEVFKENARELRRSNKELGDFAYAASHDLKSPLSAIKLLAQWIIEDTKDSVSKDTRENMELLMSRIERLSTLQSDLLEYAKVSHSDEKCLPLILPNLIDELTDLLDSNNHYNITLDSVSEKVVTYVVPFRQVLMNLLSNAIKHHDSPHGNITITITNLNESFMRVTVSDDGPGIEEQYHEHIFEIFKTLKSKDQVEGSGLGLSLVKKMVERHGGNIHVQHAKQQRGAEFTFTWPVVT